MKTPNHHLIQICLLGAALLQAATIGAQPVTKIAAGSNHSLFLKAGGGLWVMGLNDRGQLGNGFINPTNRPQKILGTNVTAIAGGVHHTLFLKNDGSLWVMGGNDNGALGDGTINESHQPEQILATNATAVAAGELHSLFLKNDGSLWGMGYNNDGELGDTTYNQANSPVNIVATNVTAIAAGEWHSLFLKRDSSLWAMGWNAFGQLGDGNFNSDGINTPEKIVATNVTAIAAGWNHSLFLKNDGSLWAMGNDAFGQLGDGNFNSTGVNQPEKIVAGGVTAIAAGRDHSLFLMNDGSLWAMGDNDQGQLGDGPASAQNLPVKIINGGVAAIAAGELHSLFLKSDGSLWGMGYNYNGELGQATLGDSTNRPAQILGAYNRIEGRLVDGAKMGLAFVGLDGTNYALDRTFNLAPATWLPQATNRADSVGVLVFTNTPNTATNNFWRVRSVP